LSKEAEKVSGKIIVKVAKGRKDTIVVTSSNLPVEVVEVKGG